MRETTSAAVASLLAEGRRAAWRATGGVLLVAVAVVGAFLYADALDPHRYADALFTIWTLLSDALPPDFSRLPHWGKPVLETLSMTVAGTALGAVAGLAAGALAARNVTPSVRIAIPVRLILAGLRSVPGLLWGVVFVAAVGFGPLPGILALATQSTGMLGKFYAETLEHVDPAPGEALLSYGVSPLGVLRFAVLPQILPRLADVTLYRLEHNLRAATTLGVVGAGGIGLEIITAFHLFAYREAMALILVMLAMVWIINMAGARLRARFLDGTR